MTVSFDSLRMTAGTSAQSEMAVANFFLCCLRRDVVFSVIDVEELLGAGVLPSGGKDDCDMFPGSKAGCNSSMLYRSLEFGHLDGVEALGGYSTGLKVVVQSSYSIDRFPSASSASRLV